MENDTITEIITSKIDDTLPALPHHPTITNPYLHLATSDNTRRAYQSDIRHYEMTGGKLPATPDMVATYLQNHATTLNPRTLQRRLIALSH